MANHRINLIRYVKWNNFNSESMLYIISRDTQPTFTSNFDTVVFLQKAGNYSTFKLSLCLCVCLCVSTQLEILVIFTQCIRQNVYTKFLLKCIK